MRARRGHGGDRPLQARHREGAQALTAAAEQIHIGRDGPATQWSSPGHEGFLPGRRGEPPRIPGPAEAGRAKALMEGRRHVLPDDAKWCAFEVLVHRVLLKPDVWAAELVSPRWLG